ncbi:MAG: hypothetical protein GY849_07990, partial [Deltaproteobacteria bacterium]|nr:hypothetical protein [Deltaproteobacteria bacterium]
ERKSSLSITGSRNVTGLPSDSDGAEMIVPIYVSNGVSGNRVNPVRLLDMEFSTEDWEGTIDGADSASYCILSPVHELETELVCSPIQNTGTVQLDIIGVFVPIDVGSSDDISFPEQYGEVLYYYTLFFCYISIPGKSSECMSAYKEYVRLIGLMSQENASRFPSDQGIKPVPVEFDYDTITRYDMDSRADRRVTQEGA